MQNILINNDFQNSIKQLRRVLPGLTWTLLIGTYLISAIIMGIFHAQNASNMGFVIAAFLIPLAIQAGRGTLVFFFQLNPAHIQGQIFIWNNCCHCLVSAFSYRGIPSIDPIRIIMDYFRCDFNVDWLGSSKL